MAEYITSLFKENRNLKMENVMKKGATIMVGDRPSERRDSIRALLRKKKGVMCL